MNYPLRRHISLTHLAQATSCPIPGSLASVHYAAMACSYPSVISAHPYLLVIHDEADP